MDSFQSGAEIDIRPKEAKLKDFQFNEIVASAAPVDWVEKKENEWRKFPDQDQDGSGSCVAQTVKKLAGIQLWLKEKTYVTFSATDIFTQRSNKPGSGMIGVEAFDIWRKSGITLESLVPSEKINDAQMDALAIEVYKREVGAVFKIGGHVGLPNGDFEAVASVIQQTGKGVMVWFYFTNEEWSPLIPFVKETGLQLANSLRHSVAAVDFFLVDGKKYLLIEDSAHFGGITRRLISEEFFKARNWFIRHGMNFNFVDESAPQVIVEPQIKPVNKPVFTFTKVLEFNDRNEDIRALQSILQYEGLFPSNVELTGYYGAITARAVLAWQKKHNVASIEELDSLVGRRVGEKTIKALNEIYG